MHASKSLSLLAVALMQGLAAAAPHSGLFPTNGTAPTGTGAPTTHSLPIGTAASPIGTAASSSSVHVPPIGTAASSSVHVPFGTGTGSSPSSIVPITASLPATTNGTSMVDGYTTTLSTMSQTKTLTWTVMVPCTTVAAGTTSYYTTASVHTTYVPDLKTITITSACTKCAYATPTPAGPGGPDVPGTSTIKPVGSTSTGPDVPGTSTIKPVGSTSTGPVCPGGAHCPPVGGSTHTIQETKTVVPTVVPGGQSTTAPAAGVPSSPSAPVKGSTSVIAGNGACPAPSTVTIYNPTTIYATVTVTPAVYTPTTVAECPDGKCGTQTVAPTAHPSPPAPGCPNGKCTTTTTVVGCSSGKCTTITSVYTKTFGHWNGTDATATYKPTGTGFATGLTTGTYA
ncbi:unnamed protein product [Tuber aestivum]|uniref:Uncharacterized protein n=1 Tax=Tuber aestivum TaxID=59557 RepID=A0A292PXZ3_9PEZI|nr:unnamed protein product [Tuber aestivum]